MIPQDLHIHTTYSRHDGAIVEQQTVALIAALRHAKIVGISDHVEYLTDDAFDCYERELRGYGFFVGTEVGGHRRVATALDYPFDYYIYHCEDTEADYRAVLRLLDTGRPVIIAHPMMMKTDLNKVPKACLIELNNRYIWRNDFESFFAPHVDSFRYVFGSDAHQPHWLGQTAARAAARTLGIEETILFSIRTSP